jgi:hypothetical protein
MKNLKMDNPKMDNPATQPIKVARLKIHKPEALLDKTVNRQR